MEDLAYMLVPLAQIAFGAATIGAIIQGMDEKKSKLKAYLVPVVVWGWILMVVGAVTFLLTVRIKYRDPDNVPDWVPTAMFPLLIYGGLIGMILGILIGSLRGWVRWRRWKRETI